MHDDSNFDLFPAARAKFVFKAYLPLLLSGGEVMDDAFEHLAR